VINSKGNILFVATNRFQFFFSLKSKYISKIVEKKIGSFTNFVNDGFKFFKDKKLKKSPSVIIFFNLSINDFLLAEAKKKNISSVGLVNANDNCGLIDYPIFLNSFYFHNVYFFSRLVFKYILRLI
jgi:ribosomal protein S2